MRLQLVTKIWNEDSKYKKIKFELQTKNYFQQFTFTSIYVQV